MAVPASCAAGKAIPQSASLTAPFTQGSLGRSRASTSHRQIPIMILQVFEKALSLRASAHTSAAIRPPVHGSFSRKRSENRNVWDADCHVASLLAMTALDGPKPPLCKGRWHGGAVTEGLYGSSGVLRSWKNNPSVSFADSSLYTREPWALPRQCITQENPDYDDRVKQETANFL